MFSEENIMHTLVGVALIAAFIGCWLACYIISDDGEIEMKRKRRDVKRGMTNAARIRAQMAISSEVIRKG